MLGHSRRAGVQAWGFFMVRSICAGLFASLLLGAASAAQATTIFQSIADLTSEPEVNGFCSDCYGGGHKVLQPFSTPADATAKSLTFAVTTDFWFPTDITVEIYEGYPTIDMLVQIFSKTYAPADFTSVLDTAFNTSLVSVDLGPGVGLSYGKTYSLAFFNADSLGVPGYVGGALFQQDLSDGSGNFYPDTLGFRLDGDMESSVAGVPEPSTWLLMIAGFGLAGGALRRRRALA